MKRANGQGTIAKLSGNRRKPYAVKITTGWTEKGTQKYKYLSYHKNLKEAQRALNDYNRDPYTLTNLTLNDLWDMWFPLQSDKADGTQMNYKAAWNHLEPLRDIKIIDIDRVILQDFYDKLHSTINVSKNIKKTLQPMIEYAVKRGFLPLAALNLHQVIDLSDEPLTRTVDREIIDKNTLNTLWRMKDDETAKIILVLVYTGLRYSELYNLTPENCFDDHINIVKAKTKAGVRAVPLSDKVKSILPIAPVPQYQTFKDHFHIVLPSHNIHDTRHTFITMLTEAGVDDRIIKTIVGHSTKDITSTYTHITLEVMLEAVNKI